MLNEKCEGFVLTVTTTKSSYLILTSGHSCKNYKEEGVIHFSASFVMGRR